jgi:hypothetical protein
MAQAPPFPHEASFNLLNKSKDVFVIADTTGTLRFASPSAANLFGFKNGARAAASACERLRAPASACERTCDALSSLAGST